MLKLLFMAEKPKKLAVFDYDSTLMDGETLDIIAVALGLQEKVAKITERGMRGELEFFDSLRERVALLRGLEMSRVDKICHNLPLMEGAVETIRELKNHGWTVICFSGGFRNATKHSAKILGLDAEFANTLDSKDGKLTGKVGGDMTFGSSKGEMLERLQKLLDVKKENTMAVGDGANDKSMFEYADIKVAFCAKEVLKQHANVVIDKKDLTLILDKLREMGKL